MGLLYVLFLTGLLYVLFLTSCKWNGVPRRRTVVGSRRNTGRTWRSRCKIAGTRSFILLFLTDVCCCCRLYTPSVVFFWRILLRLDSCCLYVLLLWRVFLFLTDVHDGSSSWFMLSIHTYCLTGLLFLTDVVYTPLSILPALILDSCCLYTHIAWRVFYSWRMLSIHLSISCLLFFFYSWLMLSIHLSFRACSFILDGCCLYTSLCLACSSSRFTLSIHLSLSLYLACSSSWFTLSFILDGCCLYTHSPDSVFYSCLLFLTDVVYTHTLQIRSFILVFHSWRMLSIHTDSQRAPTASSSGRSELERAVQRREPGGEVVRRLRVRV